MIASSNDITLDAIISYWQTSLIDAELALLELSPGNHIRYPRHALSSGQLPRTEVLKLYELADVEYPQPTTSSETGEPVEPDEPKVPLLIAPLVAATSRRAQRFVCPLWVPVLLHPNGRLLVSSDIPQPWISRQYLEPTNSEFVLGSVEALDDYLKGYHRPVNHDNQVTWTEQYGHAQSMFEGVAGHEWPELFAKSNYLLSDRAAIVPAGVVRGATVNIERVYETMLHTSTYPPLLATYAGLTPDPAQPALSRRQWQAPAKNHAGSMQSQFPLSPSQREALYHFLEAPPASVLAVDGPPGTGKTTLIHSVIASLWVQAALRGDDPPLIVVSSTNNQAVTNVLDSLSRFEAVERWLPAPVVGFGLYLTNDKRKRARAALRGIPTVNRRDEGFVEDVQGFDYVDTALAGYLSRCADAYDRPNITLDEALVALQGDMIAMATFMAQGLELVSTLPTLHAELEQSLRPLGPADRRLDRLAQEREKAGQDIARWKDLLEQWPKVARKTSADSFMSRLGLRKAPPPEQAGVRTQFLHQHLPQLDADLTDQEVRAHLVAQLEQARKKETVIAQFISKQTTLARIEREWGSWCEKLGREIDLSQLEVLEDENGNANDQCLHNVLDVSVRFYLFELAVHYWEGRWLQAMLARPTQPGQRESQRRDTQESKWRRYAMLTPCFVTTMHTGPGFFDYFDGEVHPLFDTIDVLIVDEAGQVSPEVSGAMFALAKRALVVGDTQQIEPVWGVTEAVDQGNLSRLGLVNSEAQWAALMEKGVMASNGSVMRMAQNVSLYQQPSSNGPVARGIFLAEHRRSVPEVIAFSNELAYKGRLRPLRPPIEDHPWPHMGYAHVQGVSATEGGSRKNVMEAEALVGWLALNRDALEQQYDRPIEEIAGVITPFVAQNRVIKQELEAAGLGQVDAGTVHTFQGGERDIMLFSSVYSSRDEVTTYFFDRGVNLLNVAVSRARDSFIVFGDMDIFDTQKVNRPSALLARFLFADIAHELTGYPYPVYPSVDKHDGSVHRLDTLAKHVGSLARAFERARERLVIVSPYLREPAVMADSVPARVAAAVGRGVAVTIYIDDAFNRDRHTPNSPVAGAVDLLRRSGATVKACHNIHSKVLCVDSDVYIVGSFNWLSAARQGAYQRYETSIVYTDDQAVTHIRQTIDDLERRAV